MKIDKDKLGLNPFLISLTVEEDEATEPFCRVFTDDKLRARMGKLTPRGKDLLWWLIYEVEEGKDWVELDKKLYMEECGVSTMNTYRAAVNDLIGGGYINKTVVTDVFWINPALFFNGSRVAAFPNNVKVK